MATDWAGEEFTPSLPRDVPLPPPPDPEMEWQEIVSLWPNLVPLKGLKDGAERGALWDTDSGCDIGQGICEELGLGLLQPCSPQSLLPPSLLTQSSRDRDTGYSAVLSPWSATVRGTAR